MKKLTALMLSILIVLSAATALVGAAEAEAPAWTTKDPDLIITEICPDQKGNGDAGYSDNKNPFEWFEIYNNSDVRLSLYDYCLTYNGSGAAGDNYENVINEITPFLTNNKWENKPGNYLDGSTLQWTNESKPVGDLSNLPTNPETCFIEPGECVVVWCMYYEAYLAAFNEGKGMSVEDFRKFWNIPDSVKVIAFDGNSATGNGGHDKNFNIKNKDCGTYGIAKYSDALNSAANVLNSTYAEKTYREFEDLVSWSSLDYKSWELGSSQPNKSFNFTVDAEGAGAKQLTSLTGKERPYDKRRAILCEKFSDPTPGELTSIQKLTLPGYTFKAGETVTLPTADEAQGMTYNVWSEDGKSLTGLRINGTAYLLGATYTAASDGTVTVEPVYDGETIATTDASGDQTIAEPTGDNGFTVVAVVAAVALISFAAILVTKRKENN